MLSVGHFFWFDSFLWSYLKALLKALLAPFLGLKTLEQKQQKALESLEKKEKTLTWTLQGMPF